MTLRNDEKSEEELTYRFKGNIRYLTVTEIKYDQNLVQRLFLKSLVAGLTSETIMTEIKHLLRNSTVSIKALYSLQVRLPSSFDQQRSIKLNKKKIRPRLNAADTEYEAENELNLIPSKHDSTKENKSGKCLTY